MRENRILCFLALSHYFFRIEKFFSYKVLHLKIKALTFDNMLDNGKTSEKRPKKWVYLTKKTTMTICLTTGKNGFLYSLF